MTPINNIAKRGPLMIDNAATASQCRALLDDAVVREAITLNIIAPLLVEISERDARIAALEAEASEDARLLGQAGEKIANLSGEIDRLKRDFARAEAEASEGERRGLERAAEMASRMYVRDAFRFEFGHDVAAAIRALIPEAPEQHELGSAAAKQISTPKIGLPEGWQPISSAPKDGTVVDLWHEDFGRQADFKWGHTEHSCGEAGRYCDSDWHSEEAGWVNTALNERFFAEDAFTHWRPLPSPPQDREEQ